MRGNKWGKYMYQSFQWRERGQCVIHKDEGKVKVYCSLGARCPVTEKRGFLGKPTMSGYARCITMTSPYIFHSDQRRGARPRRDIIRTREASRVKTPGGGNREGGNRIYIKIRNYIQSHKV